MTASPNLSRASSVAFVCTAIALTIGAFTIGRKWHDSRDTSLRVAAEKNTRIAQTGQMPITPSRYAASKTKSIESEKRLRAASMTFTQVHDLVRNEYVDELPSDQTMSHGVVQAMLSSLEDEQSYFFTPSQYQVVTAETSGKFEGIGAVTAVRSAKNKDGFTELRLLVVAPLPGSPAEKAGLRTGDRITQLDERYILSGNPYLSPSKMPKPHPTPSPLDSTQKEDPAEQTVRDGIGLLVAQMQLRQGTTGSHTLVVQRPGVTRPLRFTVPNARIAPAPAVVRNEEINSRSTLYIRCSSFTTDVADAVVAALRSAAPSGSVVLDLRQNPGAGSLIAAETIAASLAASSDPFAIEVGAGGKRTPLPLSPADISDTPRRVSVLTDGGTAGFAEALAMRLSDSGATIVGSGRTWGDGRSQTVYPLPDGAAFTLTTGKLVSPKGFEWEKIGLAPRVTVPNGLNESETVALAVAVAAHTGGKAVATTAPLRGAKR